MTMRRQVLSAAANVNKLFNYSYLRLRERAGEEYCAGIPSPSLADQEDHILPGLELAGDTAEVVLAVYRLLVDLQDHVAAAEADVLREGPGLHVTDYNALIRWDSQAIGHVWRDGAYRNAHLSRCRLFFSTGLFLVRGGIAVELGTISDCHCRFGRFATTLVPNFYFRTRFFSSDIRDQFVASLHMLSVH